MSKSIGKCYLVRTDKYDVKIFKGNRKPSIKVVSSETFNLAPGEQFEDAFQTVSGKGRRLAPDDGYCIDGYFDATGVDIPVGKVVEATFKVVTAKVIDARDNDHKADIKQKGKKSNVRTRSKKASAD